MQSVEDANPPASAASAISLIIPTYNRARTLQDNIGQYLAMQADETIFSNNCSTDHTADVIQTAIADHPSATLHTNAINLGYPRSLFRAVITAKHDLIAVLSDEDYPLPSLFSRYRRIISDHPGVGAIVRAATYPKPYAIPAVEARVDRSDATYAYIPPGAYAAYMAYVQCSYVGGSLINRAQVRNLSNMAIESCSYPHRLMIMDAAFHGGLALVLGRDMGMFPKENASAAGESSTQRHGDWCVGEWLHTAELIGSFYPDSTLTPAIMTNMRSRLFKFVCNMFSTYFSTTTKYGQGKAVAYLESVQVTSDLLNQPLAWLHINAWMAERADDKQRAMLAAACEVLRARAVARINLTNNPILRNHVVFGRGIWQTTSKTGI